MYRSSISSCPMCHGGKRPILPHSHSLSATSSKHGACQIALSRQKHLPALSSNDHFICTTENFIIWYFLQCQTNSTARLFPIAPSTVTENSHAADDPLHLQGASWDRQSCRVSCLCRTENWERSCLYSTAGFPNRTLSIFRQLGFHWKY